MIFDKVNFIIFDKICELVEKNVKYENQIISLFQSEQYSSGYLKINPRGLVPTLVHGHATIFESTIICEYIDETFDGLNLLPIDPVERALARIWTKLVDDEIHEAGSTLSFCAMFRDRMLAMTKVEQEKRFRNVGNPIREEMYRSSVELGVDSPFAFRSIASYEMMIRDLEIQLSNSNNWILNDKFSLAEIGLTPYFARVEFLGLLNIWTDGRPLVQRWWSMVKSRESYISVIKNSLSVIEIKEMQETGGKIYNRVRDRRLEYLSGNSYL